MAGTQPCIRKSTEQPPPMENLWKIRWGWLHAPTTTIRLYSPHPAVFKTTQLRQLLFTASIL